MKIKIFESDVSAADLENIISEWTEDLKPTIISVNINVIMACDYYANKTICNTWEKYICSIVYKLTK